MRPESEGVRLKFPVNIPVRLTKAAERALPHVVSSKGMLVGVVDSFKTRVRNGATVHTAHSQVYVLARVRKTRLKKGQFSYYVDCVIAPFWSGWWEPDV